MSQVKEKNTVLSSSKTIDAGIGQIRWTSNNLQLMEVMEAIEEQLQANIAPLEITRRIKG